MYSLVQKQQAGVRKLFRLAYDTNAVFMEHGPARPNEVGACIDHAHLHCLPNIVPVRQALDKLLGKGHPATFEDLHRLHSAGESYLFVDDGEAYVFPLDIAPSQFLRQVVATAIGHTEWTWQSSRKSDVVRDRFRRTTSKLSPFADELLWACAEVTKS